MNLADLIQLDNDSLQRVLDTALQSIALPKRERAKQLMTEIIELYRTLPTDVAYRASDSSQTISRAMRESYEQDNEKFTRDALGALDSSMARLQVTVNNEQKIQIDDTIQELEMKHSRTFETIKLKSVELWILIVTSLQNNSVDHGVVDQHNNEND